MSRERIMSWDNTNEKMVVMQDKRTTYDLGGNPVEIQFYDNAGWAYTETRTYARGYQLTDFSTSEDGDVTINTAGSYTYDTNNNMTGTKKFDASRSGVQLSYRAQWSFTFDRKNRLKTYTNTDASNVRGNLWYDGKGRVWQRWNYDTGLEQWDATLKRFVYDGATLVQEHTVAASVPEHDWVYTYIDINRDYLRHPAGLRQREGTAASNTDYFLQTDEAALEYKIERDPTSATADRTERSASLDQIAGGSFTTDLSNLATSTAYIEMYGDASTGFDALVEMGRHFLSGVGRYISRRGNCPYCPGGISDLPAPKPIEPARPPEWWDDLPEGVVLPHGVIKRGISIGGDGDEGECSACCREWFYDLLPGIDAFCYRCCGNVVGDYDIDCPEGPISTAVCRRECCFAEVEPGPGPIAQYIFEECVVGFKKEAEELASFMSRFSETVDWAKFAYCLIKCASQLPGMRESCIVGCVWDKVSPLDYSTYYDLIRMLYDALPDVHVDCCQNMAARLQDEYGIRYDLAEGCCSAHWALLASDRIDNLGVFTNRMLCCIHCRAEDYSEFDRRVISGMEHAQFYGGGII